VIFVPTSLPGVVVLEPELQKDERGFFARTWCEHEFAEHDMPCRWVQHNVSFNRRRGTLRGLHYQAAPCEETKLVQCTRGAIYDVVVDIRPASPSYGRWLSFELTAENHRMLYIGPGFAHGFQTLCDQTEVQYHMSAPYATESARGLRWNDPSLSIEWPEPPTCISPRDVSWPLLRKCA
jgi:dTDP-4-dehydrorhamnose 3,5-epimerase